MRFPWQKRETRNYTDAVVEYLASYASGETPKNKPAAIEIAAGLWGRAFASATVTPETPATAALSAAVLEGIGRRLLLRGEAVYRIDVNGAVRLFPASDWTITGGVDSWLYKVKERAPYGDVTRTLPASGVVHVRIGADPDSPWKGFGPLENASTSTALAGRMEARLAQEADAKVGSLLPVPEVKQQLQDDINRLKGEVVLVRGPQNWDTPGRPGGAFDLRPQRLGFNPPESIEPLRDAVSRSVLAAAGVPAALLGRSDGTLLREAQRQFLHGTISPVGKIVAVELADKLDAPGLSFDFAALFASDIAGRARAFASMVKGGMSVERAAVLSGLITVEDAP